MQIPWWLLFPECRIAANGASNCSGFAMELKARHSAWHFRTRSYQPHPETLQESSPATETIIFVVSILTALIAAMRIGENIYAQRQWTFPALGLVWATTMFAMTFTIIAGFCAAFSSAVLQRLFTAKGKKANEWHAIEHQFARLCSEERAITRETLAATPALHIHCGSVLALVILEISAAFLLFIYWATSPSAPLLKEFLAAVFCVNAAQAFFVLRLGSGMTKFASGRLFVLFLLPSFALPLAFQALFLLKKPAPEKIEETIAAFEAVREEYQRFLASLADKPMNGSQNR